MEKKSRCKVRNKDLKSKKPVFKAITVKLYAI